MIGRGLAVAAAACTSGGSGGAAGQQLPGTTAAVAGAGSLKAHAAARGLLAGCAVDVPLLRSNETYRRTIAEQYSMVVAENCMKWEALRPSPDKYSFAEADELVNFAETQGMAVRGHNLCWHEAVPYWFKGGVTKENARAVLTDHIQTVMTRYKGRIHSWDVANEAVWIPDGRPDGLRMNSVWWELIGPEYIELAFRAARAADPAARLTYNDYGIEYDTEAEQQKRAAVLQLLRRLKTASVPIDAVGVQSHIKATGAARLGDGIADFAHKARGLGLEVYLTELDVNDDTLQDEGVSEVDKDIADVYGRYLGAMLREPAVKAVLTWGVADDHTWLSGARWRTEHPGRGQRPLLFDEQYRPKDAFFAVRAAIDAAGKRAGVDPAARHGAQSPPKREKELPQLMR